MDRRSFIKGLIALASAPAIGKYVNIFKTEGAREGIEQVASQGVDFFNMVIKKVMDEGNLVNESDRIQTFKHPDRPDITVDVDLGSGSSSVYFDTDQGTKAGAELVKDIEVGPGYTELLENEEVYKMGGDEYYKDVQEEITGGITNLEKFLKGKRGFAAGGRVGMVRGGVPKGLQAAMRAIMEKYGKDSIKTVEDTQEFGLPYFNIDRPEKAIARDKFKNFGKEGKFAEDGTPDYDYYADLLNHSEDTVVFGDETIEELEALAKPVREYQESMYDAYKTRKLDPEVGSVSQARLNFLRRNLEEAEMTGDRRLISQDEIEELEYLENYFRKDYLDFKAQQTDRKMTQEEIEELKELGEKGFKDGGLVNLTAIKIPDISESGVESLFKRR
jgi:hypothetical protein